MSYQQEKQAYNTKVELLKNVEVLDAGPGKGTPAKVAGVYLLSYKSSWRDYDLKCLAAGPFDTNLTDRLVIKGQTGDYRIYLLDKELDPDSRIIIILRGTTARILISYGVVLTFNYACDPLSVRDLAATLAVLVLKDDTTLDKLLTDLLHPQEDKTESDF